MVMAQDALYHRRRVRELPLLRHWSRYRPWRKRSLRTKPWTLSDAPDMDMTPVHINISLPKCVLEDLDRKASAWGSVRRVCSGLIR